MSIQKSHSDDSQVQSMSVNLATIIEMPNGTDPLDPAYRIALMAEAAVARVCYFIEQAASGPGAMPDSAKSLATAKARLASAESRLEELEMHVEGLGQLGLHPLDRLVWEKSCQSKATLVAASGSFYSNAFEYDWWVDRAIKQTAPWCRDAVRAIGQSVRLKVLGCLPFDPEPFERSCEAAATEAYKGCGQSDVLFSKRVTFGIDGLITQVPTEFQATASAIGTKYGWLDKSSYQQLEKFMSNDGCCAHGLDPDCCPAGCGDLFPSFDDLDWPDEGEVEVDDVATA